MRVTERNDSKELLTETDLTFHRAVEIAHTMENAAVNARKLQTDELMN